MNQTPSSPESYFISSLRLVISTNDPRLASDYALVLSAVALPHRLVDRRVEALPVPEPEGNERFCVVVSEEDLDRAHALLDADREDRARRELDRVALQRESVTRPASGALAATISLGALLIAVFSVAPGWDSVWAQRWANETARIVDPSLHEWWRTLTAVFVHADEKHLANNLSFLAPAAFFAALRLSAPAVIGGFVFTGWAGNWASVGWHGLAHRSVGASGAVFGVIGLILGASFAASAWRADPKRRRREVIGAGLALIGLTAFAEHSDMMAHLGGCLSGVLLGAGFVRLPDSAWAKTATSVFALLMVAAVCCVFALSGLSRA